MSNLDRVRGLMKAISTCLNSETTRKQLETELIQLLPSIDVNSSFEAIPRDNEPLGLLHYHFLYGHHPSMAIIEKFIVCGADVNRSSSHGTVLFIAISNRQLTNVVEVVKLLLDNGADPNCFKNACFEKALNAQHLNDDTKYQILQLLLKSPIIKIDAQLFYGFRYYPDALYQVLMKPTEKLRLLIHEECQDLLNEIQWRPNGNKELDLLVLLIDVYGLDINAADFLFQPSYLDEELFDYILNHEKLDLEVRRRDFLGRSPLEFAFETNNYKTAIRFIKTGAKLENCNLKFTVVENFTPLFKLITMKGFDYLKFFEFEEKFYAEPFLSRRWHAIQNELNLFKGWFATVPKRRGTIMELVVLRMRRHLTREQIMEAIGDREIDPTIKFFALEPLDWIQ